MTQQHAPPPLQEQYAETTVPLSDLLKTIHAL
jgi:hypothetical protein